MKLSKILIIVVVSVLAIAGCRSNPVQNVDNAMVGMTASGKDLTTADVKKAIVAGGAMRGWSFEEAGDGHLVGTLMVRKHVAVIDVNYDAKSYSIKYKDSQNLNYDGSNIHSNYNSWIMNLKQSIDTQLRLM
ncbi:hypothetical protein [Kaarinaea lacus]